jgi:hypothetical protein
MPVTPNIQLNLPPIGSNNWGTPLNSNFSKIDQYLSGLLAIPGLSVDGDVTITGTVTAGAFSGLDGAFLTSALFNQPNGIPQLNGATKIPAALLPTQGLTVITFSSTPVFDASLGAGFKLTLTGDVSSSTFVNGSAGPALIAFRIVQDAIGGRAFAAPANLRNFGVINPGPNARSLQLFMVDTDGSGDAIGPMMYS